MYIIADIEWNMNKFGLKYPTQLAAVKVDESWNAADRFSSFIRPRDESFHNWWHVSYRGGRAEDFKNARNAYAVLADFLCWLDEDDILLWWYEDSAKVFGASVNDILKTKPANKTVILGDYVYDHLSGQENAVGNAYKLAEARGIDVNRQLKNNSVNDVRVMHELVQKIGFPQSELQKPLPDKESPVIRRQRTNAHQPYQYDTVTNTMHIRECDKFDHDSMDIKGYETLNVVFHNDIRICGCCKQDHREAQRERNRLTIRQISCTYICTESSDVFHRRDCFCMLSAADIKGIRQYETAIRMGKRPCSRCNPTEKDMVRHADAKEWRKKKNKTPKQTPPREVDAAMKRQKIAAAARTRLLNNTLTDQQKADIYTLTQPRFAFFAGRGYSTFHKSDCGKLRGVTNIYGYARYCDAMRVGLKPCRHCRPSPKQDILLSIPITSRQRTDDCVDLLEQRCKAAGYPYSYEEKYFCLETPVGKWKVDTADFPIKLKHINLAISPLEVHYHTQPRLFLSFVDVFSYIRRHDEELMRKHMEGGNSRENNMLMRNKLKLCGVV